MSIVDTFFGVRKERSSTARKPASDLPDMLEKLGPEDATQEEFRKEFLAGVKRYDETESAGTEGSIPQSKGANAPVEEEVSEPVAAIRDNLTVTYSADRDDAYQAATYEPAASEIDEASREMVESRIDALNAEIAALEADAVAAGERERLVDDEEVSAVIEDEPELTAEDDVLAADDDADEEVESVAEDDETVAEAVEDEREEFALAPSMDPDEADDAELRADDDGGVRRFSSPRLAEFAAFRAITSEMESKLESFAETVAMSRLTFSSMAPFLAQFEVDIQVADSIEKERNALVGEIDDNKRSIEIVQRELAQKLAELAAANERNHELRTELELRRNSAHDLTAKHERLGKEVERLSVDLATARAEIVRLVAALERETAEKESYYQSRIDISNKYLKLQQSEAQVRNKFLELTAQHDKLAKSQPTLIAEQEKLRSELRVAQREKADMQNRLLATQDQIMQLESEIQSIQGHAASEAYSSKTELEMQKSALRTSEKALQESESRQMDLQRQLREAEAAKSTAESQVSLLQSELENVRKERSEATFKLSDVNLKYMTDLLSLDHQREQNKEFQYDIDALLAEKRRMAKFESLYKAADSQIVSLKEKLALLAETLKDTTDPEKLRRSIEIIGELSAPHVPANTDKPPRAQGSGKKSSSGG